MAGTSRFGNPVDVPTPTAGGHAANKTYVDGRVADAANVTSGQFSTDRMPRALSSVVALTGQTGAIAIDASAVGNFRDITAIGNVTIGVPTNPSNHQVLHFTVLASGATRTVTLTAGIVVAPGVTFPASVPSGKVSRFSMEYVGLLAAWIVTAGFVSP